MNVDKHSMIVHLKRFSRRHTHELCCGQEVLKYKYKQSVSNIYANALYFGQKH